MKVQNRTHWRTDHIRAFLSRIAKEELDGHWAAKLRHMRVEVNYTRPGRHRTEEHCRYSSGLAAIGGFWMSIRIAKDNPDPVDFAHVIAHEMAHLRGMRHDMMWDHPRYRRVGNWRELYGWATTMPLERKSPKAKPDPIVQRQVKAEAALKTWQRKLKLARTKVKLYERKVRYYAKRDLALAATSGL